MKKKILFLCIGNSCRSQMAEGFARRYGADVMDAASAGLAPAAIVQPETKLAMLAKNINIDDQFPKDLTQVPVSTLDLIVNMSGAKLSPRGAVEVRDWEVEDPIGKSEEVYTAVCNQIEQQVQMLILELRRDAKRAAQSEREPAPPAPVPRLLGLRGSRR